MIPDPRLYIAGKPINGPRSTVVDPWTLQGFADVVQANAAQTEQAVAACAAAFRPMRQAPAHVRSGWLAKVAQGLEAQSEPFAQLIVREAGKPLRYARAEVARAVDTFRLAAEEASRGVGELLALDRTAAGEGYVGAAHRVPAGPVLAFAPFNFPLNLVAHKVAPALALGAPVLLKPPPQAPLSSLALAALVRESGAPESAFQVLPCEVPLAQSLVKDERFAVFSFTGSAAVGWQLKGLAGKKRVLLELGGNAAAIVHEDASLPWARERLLFGAFAYAGQVCIKVQRLILHERLTQGFLGDLLAGARGIVPANPAEESTVVGPLIDEGAAQRIATWVDEASARGARVLLGNVRNRNRLGPNILAFTGDGHGFKVVDEEVFGPVLTVHTYRSWEEALALANAGRYGLQAGVFTDSQQRIDQAFRELEVGGLIVNDVPTFRVDAMPYGGVRDSGLGREGVRYAMAEMSDWKLLARRTAG
jgi:glyceraldehyde-3-phosphate dehydrogenase (NADP+)